MNLEILYLRKNVEFLSFAENMGKNIGSNLRGKYNQKLLNHAEQCTADAFQAVLERAI